MATAISAADGNFSLVIQFLHSNSVWTPYRSSELIGSIKGTYYHVASTPREFGVLKFKSSESYLFITRLTDIRGVRRHVPNVPNWKSPIRHGANSSGNAMASFKSSVMGPELLRM
jgi:hypothetical protein